MSKKVIGIIIAAVLLIAVTVGIVAINLSKVDVNEEKTTLSLKELDEKILEISPFNEMATEEINEDFLSNKYFIDMENVENYIGRQPVTMVHASMYLVVEAKEGKAEEVKEDLDQFVEMYEQNWEMYLPDQYDLVKNRKYDIQGNYVYLIIAKSAEEIEALIK